MMEQKKPETDFRPLMEGLRVRARAAAAAPEIKTGFKKRVAAGKKKPEKTGRCPPKIEAQVQAVLLELMRASESDSVRVAAAKALIDKIRQNDPEADDVKQREDEERAAAIVEARALLGELAEAKSRGLCEPRALDQGSAS
jgi:hypothetical protein